MKQSFIFTRTFKTINKEEKSTNAQLLIRAGYVDKLTSGIYSFLPLGLRVFKKIEKIIREEMNKIGGQEIFMPAIHPKEIWQKTGRWQTMDDLFKTEGKQKFALGPTHEEVVVPLAKKFISTYKDLPFAAYQIQTKFRNEQRAKSGLLRGREFVMKDLYSFHSNSEDLDKYYEKVKKSYFKIFKKVGIGKQTYLTYASGGSFSKYSHEFQTITDAGEDTIYICKKCGLAINKEIKGKIKNCPNCGGHVFEQKKAIEVGNIFKLGTKYSAPFDLNFIDKDGRKKLVIMGCYGIGINRLIGTIVEINNDKNGIIWPKSVAPFLVHLVWLKSGKAREDSQSFAFAKDIYNKLSNLNIEVLFDDRSSISNGQKLVESDLLGMPWRIVVSQKTLSQKKVELKSRSEKISQLFSLTKAIEKINK